MEIWDLFDENRQKTNKTIYRSQACPDGFCRLVVHVCIFNKKGEMLIQQRSSTKKSWPNAWDITLGGCAIKGETSKQAIERELYEELGIRYNFSKERPYLTINFDNGFDDFYLRFICCVFYIPKNIFNICCFCVFFININLG